MRRKKILFFIVLLLVVGIIDSAQAEIVVIVNPSAAIDELNIHEVRRIFLGKPPLNSRLHLIPINQPGTSNLRVKFEKLVLGKSPRHIRSYWVERIFTGKGVPPKEAESSDAVISYVSNNVDAIGYVDEAKLVNSVKSVLVVR